LVIDSWQRRIKIEKLNGITVVRKKNKKLRLIRDIILVFSYLLISIVLIHPSPPPKIGIQSQKNEGFYTRKFLKKNSIITPNLLNISDFEITEEFVGKENFYEYASKNDGEELAYIIGQVTGRLHNVGFVFTDNKSQNYLVDRDNRIVRTDLVFIQKNRSVYARSIDIGSFLASILNFEYSKYSRLEKSFLVGYKNTINYQNSVYLSIILRNILSIGLGDKKMRIIKNMLKKTNFNQILV